MSDFPNDLRYTKDHEWARKEGALVRVGITRFAVDQLGDVTLVDLPVVGATVKAEGHFGDIESVKTVSELFAPVEGEVVEVNPAIEANPELVNDDPYGEGWLIALRPTSMNEVDSLMDAGEYQALVDSQG
jgi:glycine cleavage system H protein